ncbi:MAG: PASTA domain-containing protein [Flavobacteriaceae bacterium]|nr:PASTA domain-containing protein [Flavobacteriaceae bacterium]
MRLIAFLKSKVFLKQIVFVGVLSLAMILVMLKWLTYTTNHSQKIEVPNLSKMTSKDYISKLENLNLNYKVIDSSNYSRNFPAKSVISQSPKAGSFVKENRKIYLTLNPSMYKTIYIPNVLGKTKRLAIGRLASKGINIGRYIYINDLGKDVIRGVVYKGKRLTREDKIPVNSTVDLILGNGRKRDIQ